MDLNTLIIIIFIPIISALIGWFTNYIAIKSLFKPYTPINILWFTIQGVIPKRREKMAKKIAKTVTSHLFSIHDLEEKLTTKENLEKLKLNLSKVIKEQVIKNLPVMVQPIAEPIISNLIAKEGDKIILRLIKEFVENTKNEIDIEKLVEEKLLNYDVKNLEKVIFGIARDELKHIELLGAVIGFIVGLFQVVMFIFLN